MGVHRLMPSSGGISPLTCTIFDPTYFGGISRNHVFHISPTRLNNSIMGNYSTSVLKSHTGATQALTGARESWLVCRKSRFVHYYSFFSVFGLWHKANSAHFSGSYEKICSQIKKLTCNCSFSELTSHTTKEISSASCPVFCRVSLNPKTKKWIGCATRADSVAQCVIRGYWLISWGCLYFEVKRFGRK